MFNDVLQWLSLVLLLLLVLANYRQLGHILMDRRELLSESFGPSVGESGEDPYRAYAFPDAASFPLVSSYLALFVSSECHICSNLIAAFERQSIGNSETQMVTVVVEGDDVAYVDKLRKRLPRCNVTLRTRVVPNETPGGFPFAIRFNRDWEVEAKRVGTEVVDLIEYLDLEDLTDLKPPPDAQQLERNTPVAHTTRGH